MEGQAINEIERPRSATELVRVTFDIFLRFPFLFLLLAGAVVVPYEVIVLVATGTGPFNGSGLSVGTSLLLNAVELFLISPLVSALHVHGMLDLRDGKQPRLGGIAARALPALPVVSAAVIVSILGTAVGFLAFIVPGVLLFLRWSVVAQAAALEGKGWTDALSRSTELTRGHYLHILGTIILAGLVTALPGYLLTLAFNHSATTAASFVAGTAFQVLARSFSALATALLFFDLTARLRLHGIPVTIVAPGPGAEPTASTRTVEPTGHPLDPDSYTDEDRPPGWYIDPSAPHLMRYWAADGKPGWSKRTTKTPKQTLAEWEEFSGRR
jgi:hypothetical protein